ncbi:MAG: adenosylmethionine decarboxylase [Nitrospiria bacterium]
MQALGSHLLLELKDCNTKLLNNQEKLEEILVRAAKVAKARVIESRFHQFAPFGISGVVVIAESHLTIHSWPEYAYAAVDIFTCGNTLQPTLAAKYLVRKLQSKNPSMNEIKRGLLSADDRKLPHKPEKGEPGPYDRPEELQMVP